MKKFINITDRQERTDVTWVWVKFVERIFDKSLRLTTNNKNRKKEFFVLVLSNKL